MTQTSDPPNALLDPDAWHLLERVKSAERSRILNLPPAQREWCLDGLALRHWRRFTYRICVDNT